MGLLAGQDNIIENGDKNILGFKFAEELYNVANERFGGTVYNRYYVLSWLKDILYRTTIQQVLSSLHFTEQETLDFIQSDNIVDIRSSIYNIDDPSLRRTFITINTCRHYVIRLLKGDDNIPVNECSSKNNIFTITPHNMYEYEGKPLYNKIKRGVYSAKLVFTSEFIEDVCNIILRRFNFN